MGYQFARIEMFSRKGKEGRSTDFIFDEVSRAPGACLHVGAPGEPEIISGLGISDLRNLHDDRASSARTTTVSGNIRAIRKDQNTLVGVVLSHPATTDACRADSDLANAVRAWERRSIDWLRKTYGNQLITVVRHTDESHPHLHAYLLPNDPEMKASTLHPGFVAKASAIAAGATSDEDEKAFRKRADRAYVDAMRAWLDDYHQDVAMPSGLTRLGPGRRRLTRAEWRREQVQANSLKATLIRAEHVRRQGHVFVRDARKAAAEAERRAREAAIVASRENDKAKKAAEMAREAHLKQRAALMATRRLKGLGVQFRALFDGFRKSIIRNAVSHEWEARFERLQSALKLVRSDLFHEQRRRRDAEQRMRDASMTVHDIAAERDRAWTEVRRLEKAIGRASLEEFSRTWEYKP